MLSPEETARGRGRGYALLAELVSRGPTELTLAPARASDAVARALDAYPSLDEAAADHHAVFALGVPPLEGAFLDRRGRVGGDATMHLHDAYERLGVVVDPRGEGAEHLATQLRALGFTSSAQGALLAAGRTAEAKELADRMRAFLDRHLLRWLPSFAAAVRSAERPLTSAIALQILEVVLEHRSILGEPAAEDVELSLAGAPLDLDDPEVGVREIAAALAVPARVGLLIARDDLARVGRRHRIPRGFGERRTLIHNLLRSAVSLGELLATTGELRALVGARRAALLDIRREDVPGLAELIAPWLGRLEETDATLARLGRTSLSEQSPPPPT